MMLNTMTINDVSGSFKKKSAFELTNTASLPNKKLFNKFLNWVSGEFELYLQDYSDDLTIYFPGGHLNIQETKSPNNSVLFKIAIKSKYKEKGIKLNHQVNLVLDHISTYMSN